VLHRVKTRQRATPLVQRADGIHAAREADIEVQRARIGLRGGVGAQRHQRIVMAGVQGEHVGVGVKGHGKGALQVGMQRGDLRREPRLGLTLGPQQLGAELAELRRLPLAPDDQLAAQLLLPALEGAPDMAVGQVQRARRARDGALLGHGLQQFGQWVADQRIACIAAERVVKLDPMHGRSYRWILVRCLR
jgi:hypothetical protein